MTETLKDLMRDQASTLDPVHVDLAAIVAEGGRRRRRRAAVGALAAAAVLATVGGAAWQLRPTDDSVPIAAAPEQVFSYVVGRTVHLGDQSFTAPSAMRAMVQTSDGAVFTDADRNVWILHDGSFDQVVDVRIPADTHGRVLAVDDAGARVAFVDGLGPVLRLTVLVTGANPAEVSVPVQARHRDGQVTLPRVIAVDGSRVYFWDDRGVAVYDQATLDITVLDPDASPDLLQDAASGLLLHKVPGKPDDSSRGLAATATLAENTPLVADAWSGDLSPDGTHFLNQDADQFAVYDVRTGARQDPKHPGFEFAAPYEWLDNDTIAAVALPGTDQAAPMSLLTCHLSTNACEVTVPDVAVFPDIALPMGEPIGD